MDVVCWLSMVLHSRSFAHADHHDLILWHNNATLVGTLEVNMALCRRNHHPISQVHEQPTATLSYTTRKTPGSYIKDAIMFTQRTIQLNATHRLFVNVTEAGKSNSSQAFIALHLYAVAQIIL